MTIALVIGGLFVFNIFWSLASLAWSSLTVDTSELVPRSETLVRECAGSGSKIECNIAAGSAGDMFTKDLRERIAHLEAKHGALTAIDTAGGCERDEGFGHMGVVVLIATFGTTEQVLLVNWARLPDTKAWTAMIIAPVPSVASACE